MNTTTFVSPPPPVYYPYPPQPQQQQQQQPVPQQTHSNSTALVPATAPGATVYSNYAVPSPPRPPPTTTTAVPSHLPTTNFSSNNDDLIDLDLIDLGEPIKNTTGQFQNSNTTNNNNAYSCPPPPPPSAAPTRHQQTASTNVGGGMDMSFAMRPPAPVRSSGSYASAPPTTTSYARPPATPSSATRSRDDEFVKNLPKELIEQQNRIYSQIKNNKNSGNGGGRNNNDGIRNQQQVVSFEPSNLSGQERYNRKFDNALITTTNSTSSTTFEEDNGLPAEVHPHKYEMKSERKVKTAVAATAGASIGGLLLLPIFPVGAVAGAAIGGYAGKVLSRSGERKEQSKWEQHQFNEYTSKGVCDVQSDNVTFA